MPLPDIPAPRRVHLKLAALSLIGAALVALPLSQVLRYQGAALQAAQAERASLDPMADAVALQRSLLAHRELAAQVLQGRSRWEPPRQHSAAQVDGHLHALNQALTTLALQRPLEESRALAEDWWQLARAVAAHTLSAAESDIAHRLRVEQSLQVMDLLALAWAPEADPASGALRHAALALPRMTLQWALLAPTTPDGAAQAQAQVQARLLAALASTPQAQADPQLASAAAAAGLSTAELLRALAHAGAQPAPAGLGGADIDAAAPISAARSAALQALAALHTRVLHHQAQAAEQRVVVYRQMPFGGLWTMTALLLAGLWLWHSLRLGAGIRPGHPPTPVAPPPPVVSAGPGAASGAESRPVAGRLLDRLRGADATTPRQSQHHVHTAWPPLPPAE